MSDLIKILQISLIKRKAFDSIVTYTLKYCRISLVHPVAQRSSALQFEHFICLVQIVKSTNMPKTVTELLCLVAARC